MIARIFHRKLVAMRKILWAKIKETKIILRNIYYSIYLEVREETKLLPDSAFGNSLFAGGYKTKSEKKPVFLVSHTQGMISRGPKYAQEP